MAQHKLGSYLAQIRYKYYLFLFCLGNARTFCSVVHSKRLGAPAVVLCATSERLRSTAVCGATTFTASLCFVFGCELLIVLLCVEANKVVLCCISSV